MKINKCSNPYQYLSHQHPLVPLSLCMPLGVGQVIWWSTVRGQHCQLVPRDKLSEQVLQHEA